MFPWILKEENNNTLIIPLKITNDDGKCAGRKFLAIFI